MKIQNKKSTFNGLDLREAKIVTNSCGELRIHGCIVIFGRSTRISMPLLEVNAPLSGLYDLFVQNYDVVQSGTYINHTRHYFQTMHRIGLLVNRNTTAR